MACKLVVRRIGTVQENWYSTGEIASTGEGGQLASKGVSTGSIGELVVKRELPSTASKENWLIGIARELGNWPVQGN